VVTLTCPTPEPRDRTRSNRAIRPRSPRRSEQISDGAPCRSRCLAACQADGANIAVQLDDDNTTTGNPPLTGDALIRIDDHGEDDGFGNLNPPQHIIGSLTVNGTADPFSPVRLNILIAASTAHAIPLNPATAIPAGLVNAGRAATDVDIAMTESSLRDATRLTLSVSGATSGATAVGHMFHVNIRADMTADATITFPDIFDFLAAWFDGCSQQLVVGSGVADRPCDREDQATRLRRGFSGRAERCILTPSCAAVQSLQCLGFAHIDTARLQSPRCCSVSTSSRRSGLCRLRP
jgi:hypothetical protein